MALEKEDFSKDPAEPLKDEPSREDAVTRIYSVIHPGEPTTLENAERDINTLFFDTRRYDLGEVGRYKLNKRFDYEKETSDRILQKEDIINTMKYLIKVYQVALYKPENVGIDQILKDVPKRLEYYFFVGMKASDFQDTGFQLMAQNIGEEKARSFTRELEKLNSFYRDVNEGQRYTLTYIPDNGLEMALDGDVFTDCGFFFTGCRGRSRRRWGLFFFFFLGDGKRRIVFGFFGFS